MHERSGQWAWEPDASWELMHDPINPVRVSVSQKSTSKAVLQARQSCFGMAEGASNIPYIALKATRLPGTQSSCILSPRT